MSFLAFYASLQLQFYELNSRNGTVGFGHPDLVVDYAKALALLLAVPYAFSSPNSQPAPSTILTIYLMVHQLLNQELVCYDINEIESGSEKGGKQQGCDHAIELAQLTQEVRSHVISQIRNSHRDINPVYVVQLVHYMWINSGEFKRHNISTLNVWFSLRSIAVGSSRNLLSQCWSLSLKGQQ